MRLHLWRAVSCSLQSCWCLDEYKILGLWTILMNSVLQRWLRSFQSFLTRLPVLLILLFVLLFITITFIFIFLWSVPRKIFIRVLLTLDGEDFTVASSALTVNSGCPFLIRTSNGVALEFRFLYIFDESQYVCIFLNYIIIANKYYFKSLVLRKRLWYIKIGCFRHVGCSATWLIIRIFIASRETK